MIALLMLIAIFSLGAHGQTPTPAITLENGQQIRGLYLTKDLVGFLGVPFAATTGGSNRWKAPQPFLPTNDVIDAFASGPACYQYPGNAVGNMSENCLYMDIYIPEVIFRCIIFDDSEAGHCPKVPVYSWIFGGGYAIGQGSLYSGAFFSEDWFQPIIYVNFNYRVSSLGFFYMNGMSDVNLGLLDQQFALKWIQQNIKSFGGDPNQVTIGGESAGGSSVMFHLMMWDSQFLFQQAIMESPGIYLFPNLTEQQQASENLAKSLGCSTLDCMRQIPPEKIVGCCPPETQTVGLFIPAVDGTMIKHQPLFNQSQFLMTYKSLMIGNQNQEGNLFAFIKGGGNTTINSQVFQSQVIQAYFTPLGLEAQVLQIYKEMIANANATGNYFEVASQILGDYLVTCGTHAMISKLRAASSSVPIYRYQFTHHPAAGGSPLWFLNATHGTELAFVFETPPPSQKFSPPEVVFSHVLNQYWKNYISYGIPNNVTAVKYTTPFWPVSTGQDPVNTQQLNIPVVTGADVPPEQLLFCSQWEGIFFKKNNYLVSSK